MRYISVIVVLMVLLVDLSSAVFAEEQMDDDKRPAREETQKSSPEQVSLQPELEPVVVTATRIETPLEEVGSSVTVITADEIERKQKTTVLELLRTVPGLDVVQAGGPGGTASVFIRGAKSEHTLVLIDGVEMNDPISPGRSFDFAHLTTDNIERIEIIRGPQSTLYGSDAMGGVVNVITKKGRGKPSIYGSFEGGSFSTFREAAGLSGATGRFNYSFSVSRFDTDGISRADEGDGNDEDDSYDNTTLSGRIDAQPTRNLGLDFILRYTDADFDIDNFGGPGGDDPNHLFDTEQLFLRAQARFRLFQGKWEQTLGVSFSDHQREDRNDPDPAHPNESSRSSFDGSLLKFDWQNNLYLHRTNTLVLGLETEEEEGKSDSFSQSSFGTFEDVFEKRSVRTTGFYVQDEVNLWDRWFTTLGIRVDDHSEFGTEVTYRITSAYLIPKTGTTIRGSLGTGFKAPTLFQLHSSFGDQNLNPEESVGFDIGLEQLLWNDRVTVGVTYFFNNFDNLIDFDSETFKFVNIAEAETKGVELIISSRPIDNLYLRFGYTFTDTEDKTTGERLLRRPKHKVAFNANYGFQNRGNIDLSASYVGKRDDSDFSTFPATRVQLDSYFKVDLAISYMLIENVRLFGRVENLLDDNYQEILGFATPGISGFVGLRVSL